MMGVKMKRGKLNLFDKLIVTAMTPIFIVVAVAGRICRETWRGFKFAWLDTKECASVLAKVWRDGTLED